MYSPKERLYNTPEMSGPTGDAVLQQLRLESILRKYGRLACCEPYVYNSKHMARRLPEIKPPLTALRPFDEQRYEKVWRGLDIPGKSQTERSEKPEKHKENSEQLFNKNNRSAIPGAPPNDPYLQKPRETIGGCKYGGPNLSEYGSNRHNSDYFRPFHPQKSPLRLPCIQREKVKTKTSTITKTSVPLYSTDVDVVKHINVLHKQRSHELAKVKIKETRKRKKKARLEHEFHKWEQAQDTYLQNVHSLDSDHQILSNLEKFHETRNQYVDAEQKQRTRISDEIKRGVQRKLQLLHQDDEKMKEKIIPVCNMIFEKDCDMYHHDKTTVTVTVKTKKRKSKKKRTKDKSC